VVSVFAMDAIATLLASWKTPALTFPFVLTSWLMVLAVTGFAQLRLGAMGPPALPHVESHAASAAALDPAFLLEAWLRGVSQVFLVGNAVTGLIFVVGLAVSSWRAAVFALVGSGLGLATALTLGASATAIRSGLFGFSAVLTAIALGAIFYPSSFRTTVVAALATVFTVIVQSAMNAGFSPVGLPTFTAPFVLVTWIFLLPHLKLAPVPHQKLASATGGRGA
jgi:urea transporter